MVLFFRHVSYTDSASEMSRFENIRERHLPRAAASSRDVKLGREGWPEQRRQGG